VRDVIRYRAKIAQQRVSEIARLGNVLQDAGIKTGSVASSIATKSGRAMTGSLIDGERRGAVLADLALGRCGARSRTFRWR
jgi:transposase